ncbi:MAG: type II toxin-antitoxin system VapB family antitoxin [Rhodospirillales bacterium]|nr:type II toxin-antitoxin system VapB family antitoxin [Rhodospirillales bacterium]
MRTNIDIDDDLLREVMQVLNLPTKRAAVDAALQQVVRLHRQRQALERLQGMGWEGDLDAMREGRAP